MLGCICAKYEVNLSNRHGATEHTWPVTDEQTDGHTKPISVLLATAKNIQLRDISKGKKQP